jgi:hypothetical protein
LFSDFKARESCVTNLFATKPQYPNVWQGFDDLQVIIGDYGGLKHYLSDIVKEIDAEIVQEPIGDVTRRCRNRQILWNLVVVHDGSASGFDGRHGTRLLARSMERDSQPHRAKRHDDQ